MLEYIKNHIVEEVTDAVEYISKAIEHKDDVWGRCFYKMAENEIEHANILTKMIGKATLPNDVSESKREEILREVINVYSDHMNHYEAMKKMFNS